MGQSWQWDSKIAIKKKLKKIKVGGCNLRISYEKTDIFANVNHFSINRQCRIKLFYVQKCQIEINRFKVSDDQ